MAMPYQIWFVLLFLSIICTGYLFFVSDKNNYTDAISGLFATVFWIISGLCFAVGLTTDVNADPYTSTGLMWLFVAIGVIVGLITFVKILDIMTERKKDKKDHVNMSPIRL
jgi:membrane-bound ClpP family serine protease